MLMSGAWGEYERRSLSVTGGKWGGEDGGSGNAGKAQKHGSLRTPRARN